MSTGSFASVSSEQNTIHYAQPMKPSCGSANTSFNSENGSLGRSPKIQYPTVSVVSPLAGSSPGATNQRPSSYSVTQLQYENMRHRCKMLDIENQRLMRRQNDVVEDANRRVQMHINEIRMMKEENKKVAQSNKELRDLCCFLDDDRQKARRLAREWQKFGKYTSHVMRQEIQSYQQRVGELETRTQQMIKENEELRQLCLYLDEQRQYMLNRQQDEEESEDQGCGSSERSNDSDNYKSTELSDSLQYNVQKEHALRMISEHMQTSNTSDEQNVSRTKDTEKLLNYIQSLESRIKHLEMTNTQGRDRMWSSESNMASESDEKTIIDKWDDDVAPLREAARMLVSTNSTMTNSSGTTYVSTDTDIESAVYIMGEENDAAGNAESRTLNKIDEERELDKSDDDVAAGLPPPCAPLSASTLSVGRLSMTSDDVMIGSSSPLLEHCLSKSASTSHSPALKASSLFTQPLMRTTSERGTPLSDAVRIMKIQKTADKMLKEDRRTDENSIVKHFCQMAWDSLDKTKPKDTSAV
ncbi:unnamed protein product [Auanema sp. JU1783]|nr:unnamed protein product [Auanema sp. JU1783]